MNRFENYINQRVENCDTLKRFLKDIYQRTASLIPVRDIIQANNMKVREGFFAGFHDICPWSPSGVKMLAHCPESDINLRSGADGPPLECKIGYFDSKTDGVFRPLGTTRAWNWQEGARLQWVDDDSLIWNDIRDGTLVSVQKTLVPAQAERLGPPIHAISSSGRFATVLSFKRIAIWSQAYSYLDLDRESINQADSLDIFDLEKRVSCSRVYLSDVMGTHPCGTMDSAHHYFSYTRFSPDERQCAFFHCWLCGTRRYSRLFVKDLDNNKLHLVSESSWISHYCWDGNDALIVYDQDTKGRRGYRRWDLATASFQPIRHGTLNSDGHPQVSPNGRWMLTDTYPNRFMQQAVIIYDLEKHVGHLLLKAKMPFHYRYENRCDFHPRWNRSGTAICFDSVHGQRRSLCIIDVQEHLDSW